MISEEILKEIEKFGSLAFTPQQVALVTEIPEEEFMNALEDKTSEIYRSYYKGVYTREAELRTVVFDQALSGSTPAQTIANSYINKLKLDLIK